MKSKWQIALGIAFVVGFAFVAIVISDVSTSKCEKHVTSWSHWSDPITVETCYNEGGTKQVISIKDSAGNYVPPPGQNTHGYPLVIRTPDGYIYAAGNIGPADFPKKWDTPVVPERVFVNDGFDKRYDWVEHVTVEDLDERSCVKDKYGDVLTCEGSGRALYVGRQYHKGFTLAWPNMYIEPREETFVVFGSETFGPFKGLVTPPKLVEVDGRKVPQFRFAENGRKDRYYLVTGDKKEPLPWPES